MAQAGMPHPMHFVSAMASHPNWQNVMALPLVEVVVVELAAAEGAWPLDLATPMARGVDRRQQRHRRGLRPMMSGVLEIPRPR